MKTIRHNVFETNSSSSHSISLGSGCTLSTTPIREIHTGEFGWGYEEISDPETKASYLLTWIETVCSEEKMEGYRERLQDACEIVTGVRPELIAERDSWAFIKGYIDHQSAYVAAEIFHDNKIKEFIFAPNSILIIDNDNH